MLQSVSEETPGAVPTVAVVIPTHNRREALLGCLEHVRALEGKGHRAVVVFDGCTDGSQAAVSERFPEALQVEGDGSLWWSGAVNAGIEAGKAIGARYLLLLNDDVQPDPGMLEVLLRAAERHPEAVIGATVRYLDPPERMWCAGGWTDWWGRGAFMRSEEPPADADGLAEAHWLPGMGTLIPAAVLDRIGGIDAAAFPQYFGDADFSLRARRAGLRVLVSREARLYNDIATTGVLLPPGPTDWKTVRTLLGSIRSHAGWPTRLRFWRRHCPPLLVPWQAARFYLPLLAVITKKLTWDRWMTRKT